MISLEAVLVFWLPWGVLFFFAYFGCSLCPMCMELKKLLFQGITTSTPMKMSDEQFEQFRRQRKRWTLLLDTSEALLLFVIMFWGFQMLFVTLSNTTEPVSTSLRQTFPHVPLPFHGGGLITVSILHLIGMRLDSTGLRRRMILLQMLFFMYVEWSLLLAHLFVPGVFIMPVYIAGCIVNYFSLLRPAIKQEPAKCKSDS